MWSSLTQGDGSVVKVSAKLIAFALFFLLLDQLTKFFVDRNISAIDHLHYYYPYGGIGVFKNFGGIEFSVNHMTNKGAAWGFFGDYQTPLIILRMILIAGSIVYLFIFNERRSWQLPILLIISGAIGNVIDFFTYGHVIDMFHFVLWGYDFPVFNIADSLICIGIAILFILSWFEPPS
jgi:signal peptidase II